MPAEHFDKLLRLLEIERQAEREANKRELERYPVEMREALGKTVTRLTLAGEEMGLGGYHMLIFTKHVSEGALSPFQAMGNGDIVSVTFPSGPGSWQGTIFRVDDVSVTIALDRNPPEKLPAGPYQIDFLGSDATYYRMAEAVEEVKNAKIGPLFFLREIFMGHRRPRLGKPGGVTFINERLNEFQRRAVETALAAPEVALIHGPPGTGKTTVLIEIILQAARQGLRVLASAPSNIAVDNMLEKLLRHRVKVVRLGHPARISESLRHATLDALILEDPLQEEIRRLRRERDRLLKTGAARREAALAGKEIRSVERMISKAVLGGAQVILATHAGLTKAVSKRNFDLAIMDEASQATEPLSWIPLSKAGKVVFAGDTFQLPPTIYSKEALRGGLSVTLLEKLREILPKGSQTLLRIQYRMNEKIMEFSSRQFYDNKLIADDSVRGHLLAHLPEILPTDLTHRAVLFIDTAGAGWDESWNELLDSRENQGEAGMVRVLLGQLKAAGIRPHQVGILSPYVAQVRLLKGLIREPGLEIGSVDGFQGREKEAVILSLVRSNERGEIGFLSDTRRMNVAMTRARRLLLVIGDSATIGRHPFYAQFLEYADSHNAHRSSYEWTREIL
ncbi:MAG: AAA family ATPase [Elusimicrobia bacterium]|nr:AAA family ATPase [Elusimicrobiota bacterium]